MNNHSLIRAVLSLLIVLLAWNTPAVAKSDRNSFAKQCAPGLQTSDPGRPPDTMPGQVLQECREQFAAGVAANNKAPAAQLEMAAPFTCPVTSHDIVVDNIVDLRLAAATAAPGSVIGIDGMIDINSDGGEDVMVSVPGVTITCASDDAGLTGFSDPGAGAAVLWIQADDVTVRYLNVDASFGRGILFGDRFFSGAISANNGLAEYNRLSCTITCLFFWDVDGGIGRHNVVAPAALANFGFVALFGQNVTFSDNLASNCAGGCVLFQEHLNGSAIGNTVEQCGGSCIQAFFVGNVSFLDNKSPQCNIPGTFADCIRIEFFDQALVEGNEMHKVEESDGVYGFSIIAAEGPDLQIRRNTTTGGFYLFVQTEHSIIENNHLRDCGDFDACLTGFENTDLTVRHNAMFAEAPGDGDSVSSGIELRGIGGEVLVAHNIVHGAFRIGMFIGAESFSGAPIAPAILSVRQNDLRFDGGILASGIRMGGISDSVIEKNHIELFTAETESTGIELFGTVIDFQFFVDGVVVDEFERFDPVRNNIVRNNRVMGAETGLLVNAACDNRFFGNNLQFNHTGAAFQLQNYENEIFEDPPGTINEFIFAGGGTGGNDFRGNSGIVVEEVGFGGTSNGDGYLDCDGDGTTDPNTYSGRGPM